MLEVSVLKELLFYASEMARGIDPTSGIHFDEDTVLNSSKIKKYNATIASLITEMLSETDYSKNVAMKSGRRHKVDFYLPEEIKDKLKYSEEPISISKLVYMLNAHCEIYMKKLVAKDVANWLQRNGYLETCCLSEEKTYKVPTEKGYRLGISCVEKVNSYGNHYSVNLYNIEAQKYIVNHIDKIYE